MRIALRLLATALLAPVAAPAADTDASATLPAAAAAYLEHATAQGGWPQVAAAYLVQSTGSTTTYPASTEAADRRLLLGDAGVALTGLLLADLASTGRVRLDDPLSRYLPAGFVCADARVCALTLQQLAAQDSGLPPLPANLFPADPADPWRDYRETDLLDFLANYHLPNTIAPRESPLGNVLLAWLLGRAHGDGFASALAERVTTPLQLSASGVGRTGTQVGRRDGRMLAAATTETPLPVHLHSSTQDLARLLRAMLRPGDSPLRAALLLSRQPRDAQQRWGLGWRIRTVHVDGQEWPLVFQSGGSDGHAVFFGFRTDRQQALALTANADASLQPLGLAVLDDTALPPFPMAPAAATPGFVADDYTGLYEFSPGSSLLIRANAGGLVAQASGRLGIKLLPLSPDLFAAEHSSIRLSFQRDARGQVDSLRWSENGMIVPMPRLSRRAPNVTRTEITLAPAKLADYCGDYAVDGDVLARLSCSGGVALQFSGSAARELYAYADDRFASRDGDLELVARRDSDGRVRALDLILSGSETELPRVRWTTLSPALAATLQRERELRAQEKAAAAAQARSAATTAAPPQAAAGSLAAPWDANLPATTAPEHTPYLAPGTSSPASIAPAAAASAAPSSPASASAATASAPPPSYAPVSADAASAMPPAAATAATATAGRGTTPKVQAAPPKPPAQVEPLPEKFERPRFAPPRSDEKIRDETSKEAANDGA
ncbi:MAG: serine hydrolase [Xanthomonadaceae bacterium]|nr:serine hydrolase [Xanthomonadaceae bacterium]